MSQGMYFAGNITDAHGWTLSHTAADGKMAISFTEGRYVTADTMAAEAERLVVAGHATHVIVTPGRATPATRMTCLRTTNGRTPCRPSGIRGPSTLTCLPASAHTLS